MKVSDHFKTTIYLMVISNIPRIKVTISYQNITPLKNVCSLYFESTSEWFITQSIAFHHVLSESETKNLNEDPRNTQFSEK